MSKSYQDYLELLFDTKRSCGTISKDGQLSMVLEFYVCGNPKCYNKAYLEPFAPYKHCASCLGIYYCSKECQKSHWKEHKTNCNNKEVLVRNFSENIKK